MVYNIITTGQIGGEIMSSVEDTIKHYIRTKNEELQDGIQIPLAKIAGEFNFSTVTVWRVIQKLREQRVIKIVKSTNKTIPDKIYYIGEREKTHEIVDNLIERTKGILLVLQGLRDKLKEQDDIMFDLKKRSDYLN